MACAADWESNSPNMHLACRFLPIWYRQGMLLSPAATGLLQAAMPASMAVLALCVQPVSTRIGTWVSAPAHMPAGKLDAAQSDVM